MGRQRGAAPTVKERWDLKTAVDMARSLPHHFKPISDLPNTLTHEERESLAKCEAAIETLQFAFWAAGKALQIVRDGRLYRAKYGSFDAYVEERWQMQRNYANKLIRTWRIAEALFDCESNGLVPNGTAKKVNQAQVWELVPAAENWTPDAAADIYRTVLEVDGVAVTAEILKGVVRALPSGEYDADQVAEHVRAHLASLGEDDDEELPPVAETLQAEAKRIRTIVQRVVRQDRIRQAAADNPEEVKRFVADLRELLDEVEKDVLADREVPPA
jgi:hypothetical protein